MEMQSSDSSCYGSCTGLVPGTLVGVDRGDVM